MRWNDFARASWRSLSRASTPFLPGFRKQDVDGRDKPGHDAGENGFDMIGIRHAMRPPLVRPTVSMLVCILIALCGVANPAASAEQAQRPVVHHDLSVTLDPANHRLKVRDRIRVPGALVTAPFTISLNADLAMQAASGGLKLFPVRPRVQGSQSGIDRDDQDPASHVPVNVYGVEGAIQGQELTGELNYEGVINYTARQSGGEYARAFNESPGLIEERGVYLAGSTSWVPRAGDGLITYTLPAELPPGWKSFSH